MKTESSVEYFYKGIKHHFDGKDIDFMESIFHALATAKVEENKALAKKYLSGITTGIDASIMALQELKGKYDNELSGVFNELASFLAEGKESSVSKSKFQEKLDELKSKIHE